MAQVQAVSVFFLEGVRLGFVELRGPSWAKKQRRSSCSSCSLLAGVPLELHGAFASFAAAPRLKYWFHWAALVGGGGGGCSTCPSSLASKHHAAPGKVS